MLGRRKLQRSACFECHLSLKGTHPTQNNFLGFVQLFIFIETKNGFYVDQERIY